ncbi:hypothetical protein C8Q79DRAFT_704987 [Trametes meyenii]|nr:hypothetical protein C8Q79DRAFT_704987 [Trametes meyenii]
MHSPTVAEAPVAGSRQCASTHPIRTADAHVPKLLFSLPRARCMYSRDPPDGSIPQAAARLSPLGSMHARLRVPSSSESACFEQPGGGACCRCLNFTPSCPPRPRPSLRYRAHLLRHGRTTSVCTVPLQSATGAVGTHAIGRLERAWPLVEMVVPLHSARRLSRMRLLLVFLAVRRRLRTMRLVLKLPVVTKRLQLVCSVPSPERAKGGLVGSRSPSRT